MEAACGNEGATILLTGSWGAKRIVAEAAPWIPAGDWASLSLWAMGPRTSEGSKDWIKTAAWSSRSFAFVSVPRRLQLCSLPTGNMIKPIVAPSLLSADFSCLGSEARRVMAAGAGWLHVDVMDGHFVPNLSIGPPVVQSLRRAVGHEVFLDCHLMVSDPLKWVPSFQKAGATSLTFHIEAIEDDDPQHVRHVIATIREHGMRVGMSVKPDTCVTKIFPYLQEIDLVLVMTVEPGFGGQRFIEEMLPKIEKVHSQLVASGIRQLVDISVDGGLTLETAPRAIRAGANVVVAGSSIFGAPNVEIAVQAFQKSLEAHLPSAHSSQP